MSRRNARMGGWAGAGGVTAAALESVVRGYLPYSWIEADSVELNGGTGKTENLVDRVNAGTGVRAITAAHKLIQATDAQRCAAPAASATLNNQLALTFAGAQRYRSNSPSSSWKVHDGTGWEVFTWFVGAGNGLVMPMIATAGATAVQTTAHGFCFDSFVSGANETQEMRIGNGTATPVANNATVSGGGTGGAEYSNFRYIESGTPTEWASLFKAQQIASGNSGAAPSSNDPTIALQVGADGVNANSANGVWGGYLIWNRVLTAVERAVVRSYLAVKFGCA